MFQQWPQRKQVTFTGADFYEHSMQALIHQWQKCIASGGGHAEKECFVAENHAANRYCCALCICHGSHGNKQEALLSEQHT